MDPVSQITTIRKKSLADSAILSRIIAPFVGIKLIDMLLPYLKLA
jgi:high-affinity K+ transport system ATPase subunit B